VKRYHIERYFGAALILFSFFWFYKPAEYVLIANQDVRLFFISTEHFLSFLDRPGGMLEYLGHFLTQFFRFRFAGAFFLSGLIILAYVLSIRLLNRSAGKKELLIMALIVPFVLMGLHNFYPHQLFHSLGFILAMGLAGLVPEDRGKRRVFHVIVVPALYLVGGGFVWFYCVLILASGFAGRMKSNIEILIFTVVYPAGIIILATATLFVYPLKEMLTISLPHEQVYPIPMLPFLFAGSLILLILLSRISLEWTFLKTRWLFIPESILVLTGAFLILNFTYNRKNVEFFEIEKLAILEDWDALLRYADQHPSSNLFGNYYTNLALAKKGMLCSALFNYPQPYGRRGLCFEWEAKEEILKRGSDFFWTIHFVNEAHHWSFESRIVNGFTRRNLKRLIQTELIRGNYKVAQKYIGLLNKTLFDKKLARHFMKYVDNPEAIENDRELGSMLNTDFKGDFFTDGIDLEKNLRLLISSDPENRQAYDYLMALFLLEKRVDEIALLLRKYNELTEGDLPQLLEECLLIYNLLHREDMIQDIAVSQNTMQRFETYFSVLRRSQDQNEAARALFPDYGNSFWFHMNFGKMPKY